MLISCCVESHSAAWFCGVRLTNMCYYVANSLKEECQPLSVVGGAKVKAFLIAANF